MSVKSVKLRDLSAVESPGFGDDRYKLTVDGEVYVPTTNTRAHFEEHVPPGFNPTILLLNLVETREGIGGQVFVWRKIETFERPVSRGEYRRVQVLYEGESVETVDVKEAFS